MSEKRDLYFVLLACDPKKSSEQFNGLATLEAHTFVFENSLDLAKQRAIERATDAGAKVVEVAESLRIDPSIISDLYDDQQALIRKARVHGIAVYYNAGPEVDRDHAEIRPVQNLTGTKPQH